MSKAPRSKSGPTNSYTLSPVVKFLLPVALGVVAFASFTFVLLQQNKPGSDSIQSKLESVIFSSPHSYSKPVKETRTVKLNSPLPDFSGTDIDGGVLKLSDWKGKLGLLFFADLSCPCVQAYNDRLKEIHKEYASQGLEIAYVFSDAKDTLEGIKSLVKKEQYPWRNVRDADQKLLRLFNVQCTTEVFLIDREGVLRYHGHVDDSTFDPENQKSPDLKNAIIALLNNQPIKVAETQAYACTIPRIKAKKESS